MSAEAAALSESWRVGSRTCTMTVPRFRPGSVVMVSMEWDPDVPLRLNKDEMKQYIDGRNSAASKLAAMMGGKAAVVEC